MKLLIEVTYDEKVMDSTTIKRTLLALRGVKAIVESEPKKEP